MPGQPCARPFRKSVHRGRSGRKLQQRQAEGRRHLGRGAEPRWTASRLAERVALRHAHRLRGRADGHLLRPGHEPAVRERAASRRRHARQDGRHRRRAVSAGTIRPSTGELENGGRSQRDRPPSVYLMQTRPAVRRRAARRTPSRFTSARVHACRAPPHDERHPIVGRVARDRLVTLAHAGTRATRDGLQHRAIV